MPESQLSQYKRTWDELTSYRYQGTLQDEDGNTVADNAVSALTLDLYDYDTKTTINNRSAQNVLNQNNVTLVSGVLTWKVQAADNPIVDNTKAQERHVAVITWVWTDSGGASRTGRQIINIYVRNLGRLP